MLLHRWVVPWLSRTAGAFGEVDVPGDVPSPVIRRRGMRLRWLVGLIVVLVSACDGSAAPADSGPPAGVAARVSDHGVSLRVPRGWFAKSLRGRLEVQSYHGRQPGPGQVWAAIDEFSRDPVDPIGSTFPPLHGRLGIRPGQFPPPRSEWQGGDLSAARYFASGHRHFELMVIYGDHHPPVPVVRGLDAILGTLRVEPANHYVGRLRPPRFQSEAGWHVASTPATRERPEGDQLCARASTIRYRDTNTCPIPSYTIDALPPGGMVITVDKYRDWGAPGRVSRLRRHPIVPAAIKDWGEGGYRSATTIGTTRDGSTVEIDVFIGRVGNFTAQMRRRAQAMMNHLDMPTWPP